MATETLIQRGCEKFLQDELNKARAEIALLREDARVGWAEAREASDRAASAIAKVCTLRNVLTDAMMWARWQTEDEPFWFPDARSALAPAPPPDAPVAPTEEG